MATPEELIARIDERTLLMKDALDKHIKNFEKHEEKDRIDFARVCAKITKIDKKQGIVIGVSTGVGMVFGVVGTILKDWITRGNA